MALMSLVFLDYILGMLSKKEGKGMRLFMKKYSRVLWISSSFSMLCMFAFFHINTNSCGLVLACALMHAINTCQSNLEYYTQNIMSITAKQKSYIFVFIYCEFFYRMVFLSYFYLMVGSTCIAGYMIGNFLVSFLIEYLLHRRQLAEPIIWIPACMLKGWTSAFYFRLEDTMVQDADEWTEESKNKDNFRQSQRNSNALKSLRSKVFILIRLIENIFLVIIGVIQFSESNTRVGLFSTAIILLPLYLFWHFKYIHFKFTNNSQSDELNNSVEDISNKYKQSEKPQIQPPTIQQQQRQQQQQQQQQQLSLHLNSQESDISQDNQNKRFSEKKPIIANSNNQNQHPPDQNQVVNTDSNKFNTVSKTNLNAFSGSHKDLHINVNPINSSILHQNIPLENDVLKNQIISPFSIQNKKTPQIINVQDDEDDPYGQAEVNAFTIE